MISFKKYSQQGSTLVVVLMLLLIMMILGLSIASRTTARTQVANGSVLQAQAEQAAATGSDALLALLNGSTVDIKGCDLGYKNQKIGETATSSLSDDYRKIKLTWYACEPVTTPTCSDGDNCKVYVITGVACFNEGSITDSNTAKNGCTVRRYLQGYATKKS